MVLLKMEIFIIDETRLAIILNKDDSEEDLLIYNKMQEWWAWAGVVAKKLKI